MCALLASRGRVAKLSRAVPWVVFDEDCGNNQSILAREVLNLVVTLVTRAANMTADNMPVRLHIPHPCCWLSQSAVGRLSRLHHTTKNPPSPLRQRNFA